MRKPRHHQPGGIYHVMLRGNNKQVIFPEKKDKAKFLILLATVIQKCSSKIHAYCLMYNHVHLIIEIDSISLSTLMHSLACRYVKYFNKKYKRSGHLFQGRFKSIAVSRDRYFLVLIRYIHQNPVRAQLIKSINEPWFSSHSAYLGKENILWLTQDLALSYFKKDNQININKYKTYMSAQLNKNEIEVLFKQKQIIEPKLPEKYFKTTYLTENSVNITPLYSIEEILLLCERELQISSQLILSRSRTKNVVRARNIAISLAYLTKTDSLKNLATYFSKNYTSLSRQVNSMIQCEYSTLTKLKQKLG